MSVFFCFALFGVSFAEGVKSASPRMDKRPFPILYKEWKDFLAMPERIRRGCFVDPSYRLLLASRSLKSPNPDNQFVGREYEQWITEDVPPRVLNIPAMPAGGCMPNARDIGGWKCGNGKRVRQGMIVRCSMFNAVSVNGLVGRSLLTVDSKRILSEELGIRTDIDLRSATETAGLAGSPIENGVRLVPAPFGKYAHAFDAPSMRNFRIAFETLCDRTNLPAAVHCTGGMDRTGTMCFILEGILGVSDDDKMRDWEASAFWTADVNFSHRNGIDGLVIGLRSRYRGKSLNDACVSYAIDCGVTGEEISMFREIMLEDE